jgi:esterase/lipase
MYFAIRDIQGIEKLFKLYKELRDKRVEDVYKNIKTTEDKLQSMTKAFDDFIEAFSNTAETFIKIIMPLLVVASSPSEAEEIDSDNKERIAKFVIEVLERDPEKRLNKEKIEAIKLMEYHRRNLTNSTGKIMTELLSIRANFLRDLAYYIYRSTEKYS